jgi:hypothetical protein
VTWVYRFDARALRELKKLGRQAQQDILGYLDRRVAGSGDFGVSAKRSKQTWPDCGGMALAISPSYLRSKMVSWWSSSCRSFTADKSTGEKSAHSQQIKLSAQELWLLSPAHHARFFPMWPPTVFPSIAPCPPIISLHNIRNR